MVLRRVAVSVVLAGAGGSIASMLYAGRHQKSAILILLFGMWVLSPFMAALMVSSVSKRWAIGAQRKLSVLLVILALASLAVYGVVAFGPVNAKVGFVFLVVPLASWLFIAVVFGTAALILGRDARRGKAA
jgi:hypothetical protein